MARDEWYHKNSKRIKDNLREQYANDPNFRAAKIEQATKNYAANPERKKLQSRKSALKRFFNLTPEEYQALVIAQNGVCAICKRAPDAAEKRRKNLCVDHDHKTGKKRALLCHPCNVAIGLLQDSIGIMMSAIIYLSDYKVAA